MAGFLNKLKSAGTATTSPAGKDAAAKKKEALEPPPEITPLEKMLQNAGPLRDDGTDRFFGLENSEDRVGVLSPQRFLEIFKRDNEMFRNSMHQDAHEFYGLVLNDVIANVEQNARRIQEREDANASAGLAQSVENALGAGVSSLVPQVNGGARSPGTGWVHDIFEGVLTSETKCLTCETASQRDETFLDLSIDLEEHSSVTSCLRKFSAEEMLCERNKFHCDHCGGLQEAEKRMKIKRLPKVLALHLKRFKYTEDYSRLQKLFHRVVYPYHLRMFNTTDDAEDPDRLYELYAVVVHIGGNAYHGHYVSVIKTQDRGWLLFDDEMVEPVDKHFVRNFFGDKPGTACAYVLFYQETTFEKVQAEMEAEGLEEVKIANETANLASENGQGNGNTAPGMVEAPPRESLTDNPLPKTPNPLTTVPSFPAVPRVETRGSTKEDKKREKREQEAAEKVRKQAEKDKRKADEKHSKEMQQRRREQSIRENEEMRRAVEESRKMAEEEERKNNKDAGASPGGILSRANRGSKSMTKKSFSFLNKDRSDTGEHGANGNGSSSPAESKLKDRFSFNLGRRKSSNLLS
ncbi:ubiquitin carboxyl-terminal hydrolase creB like protein [Verticillium longisporum]|uniref:ubiquitinyl hydrolase 1 n=1 Tax=Verticillium longisporum TaxID=100787 RepID=A0A8I2ZQ04_VERLO|nr:ubiquitin carboxyl-terminal hydrolase creB like protein [Verticillium longisporum]